MLRKRSARPREHLLNERAAGARCLIGANNMRATRLSDFHDVDDIEFEALLTAREQRSWLWFGLLISLGLHLALCFYFYHARFQPSVAQMLEGHQTPMFNVKH